MGILNDAQQMHSVSRKVNISHLMVPETLQRNISIVNYPLPPIPTNASEDTSMPRQDPGNILVDEDDNYLIPRQDIRLQAEKDIEDEYAKPTFITQDGSTPTNNSKLDEQIENYIMTESY